eukprot:jgi/Bigna1/135883/aug1.31_g10591
MWAAGLILVELITNKFIKDNREMQRANKGSAAWEKKDMIKALIKYSQSIVGDGKLSEAVSKLLDYDPFKRMTATQLVDLLDEKATMEEKMDSLGRKFDDLKEELRQNFLSLSQKFDGVFQAVLNFNLDKDSSDIPNYFMLLPGTEEFGDERVCRYFKSLFSKAKEKLGIQRTLWLYACDEAHLLKEDLTNGKKIPAVTTLIHEPIQIVVPGKTMIRLAPLLRVLSVALITAKIIGATTTGVGALIPGGIPGLDKLEKNAEALGLINETLEGITEGDFAAELIENEEDNLEMEENADTISPTAPKIQTKAVGEAYSALKSLLKEDASGEVPTTKDRNTLDELLRTHLVRMSHIKEGKTRWFARHDDKEKKDNSRMNLLRSCGWISDQRDDSGENPDPKPSNSKEKSKETSNPNTDTSQTELKETPKSSKKPSPTELKETPKPNKPQKKKKCVIS